VGLSCLKRSGFLSVNSKVLIVTEFPVAERVVSELEDILDMIAVPPEMKVVSVFDEYREGISRTEVKEERPRFVEMIDRYKPEWILTFGNIGLEAVTGKTKVLGKRGKIFELDGGVRVVPTISPGMVRRQPHRRKDFEDDLRYFAAKVRGEQVEVPKIEIVDSRSELKETRMVLDTHSRVAYDVETFGLYPSQGSIVSMAFACWQGEEKERIIRAVPLHHPESPFRSSWEKVLSILAPAFEGVEKQIAHNGKFDAKWLRHFGVAARVEFDTMLAAHLLDENRLKGLKPQARSRFGADHWGIDTKNLHEMPLEKVLIYNGNDAHYASRMYPQLREELIARPRLARLFAKLIMPANELTIEMERRGLWVDLDRLSSRRKEAERHLIKINRKLLKWVPENPPYDINFNRSNFLVWWLFDHLKLPILEYGKQGPSAREGIMLQLKDQHEVVPLLLERAKWHKYTTAFLSAYEELVDEEQRIHTSYRLFGTVTGRLSSGGEDVEKITGRKQRSVNLQQVPRDVFIRSIFGASKGWLFVEADYNQIELRIIAVLARERHMLRLYQTNQDIHLITAARMTGKPESGLEPEERKAAKAVNFGFSYGMGWQKFIQTGWERYELRFTEQEAKRFRKEFFELFPELPRWHEKQRRLARLYKQVSSPLGRVRHLPDIDSMDRKVKSEAERQAINAPVQSTASDMMLLSMIELNYQFKTQGLRAHIVGTVHDQVNFEIHSQDLERTLPLIKRTMEHLPLTRKFGVRLEVPIKVDIRVGNHWGEGKLWRPSRSN
jgi:DNA polymerase I-like protein with 3'-5' exonuclease and polymerase domains